MMMVENRLGPVNYLLTLGRAILLFQPTHTGVYIVAFDIPPSPHLCSYFSPVNTDIFFEFITQINAFISSINNVMVCKHFLTYSSLL